MTLARSYGPLLGAARQGSYPAWTQVCEELASPVVGYLRVRGVVDPEAAGRDVFIELAREVQDFDGKTSSFRALVFGIAHARLGVEQRYSRQRFQHDAGSSVARAAPDLSQAFELLTSEQADVVGLTIVGGLDVDQTAAVLQRAVADVAADEEKAMQELKDALPRLGLQILAGITPEHDADEVPLESTIAALVAEDGNRLSDHFILTCAARAADEARTVYVDVPLFGDEAENLGFMERLRPRATAFAATAAVVLSLSGVAWAADGASPGDWYYGLDRALEVIGIGAGGAEERLLEAAANSADSTQASGPATGQRRNDGPTSASVDETGTQRAAAAVATQEFGSQQSLATKDGVAGFLDYLANEEGLSGKEISEVAKTMAGQPGKGNEPDRPGRPDDPGRPESSGRGATGRP